MPCSTHQEQSIPYTTVDHRELVEVMGDAVVVADANGLIVLWNPAATRIFGFTEDEAMGRPLDLIIPERQRGRHNDGYAKTVETGTTRYGTSLLTVPALHKDGRRLSIAFTVALLPAEGGGVGGVAAVIRDETARFANDQQLRRRITELEAAAAAASPPDLKTLERKTMDKALSGVRILDFTHVQSGPTCTQLLAWFGADVIKVERPGEGDATRGQLRDIPGVDSLYFTMLNHNKRSITLNAKTPGGKQLLESLIKHCDVLVENFAPGAMERMGLSWERIHELNPRMVVGSVKGFGPGRYEDCKVYENVAQCAGGAASTTGFDDGPPVVSGAQIGDSGTGLHLALGIVTALYQRTRTNRGQKVLAPMQDAVLNLCRVKLRDQQRLERTHTLQEYPQYPDGKFGEAVPRAGNASGGGQPGWILRCKGYETDPNAYIYFITQAAVWPAVCKVIGEESWIDDEAYATPRARLLHLKPIFKRIEEWTMTKTKFEAMEILNKYDIPCGPILSMKEIAEDPWLRQSGTVVEVDHPARGKHLTVGNPIKLSDSSTEVTRAPLLGEHTVEVLGELGYTAGDVDALRAAGAI